jgi:hypothetical protein
VNYEFYLLNQTSVNKIIYPMLIKVTIDLFVFINGIIKWKFLFLVCKNMSVNILVTFFDNYYWIFPLKQNIYKILLTVIIKKIKYKVPTSKTILNVNKGDTTTICIII